MGWTQAEAVSLVGRRSAAPGRARRSPTDSLKRFHDPGISRQNREAGMTTFCFT